MCTQGPSQRDITLMVLTIVAPTRMLTGLVLGLLKSTKTPALALKLTPEGTNTVSNSVVGPHIQDSGSNIPRTLKTIPEVSGRKGPNQWCSRPDK